MPAMPGAELQHHPFREVLRPDRDALARLESGQQRACGALDLPVELRIGPLPPQLWIGNARDQGQAIGRRLAPPCARGRRTSSPVPQAWSVPRRGIASMPSSPPRSHGDGAIFAGASGTPRLCMSGGQNACRQRAMQADPELRPMQGIAFSRTEESHGTQIFKEGIRRRRARNEEAQGRHIEERRARARRSPAASRRSRSGCPRRGPRARRCRRRRSKKRKAAKKSKKSKR